MISKFNNNISFSARQNIKLEHINNSIYEQLPFNGKFAKSAVRVTDEGLNGDFIEITQGDSGNTKIITRFINGKKVMQETSYNHILVSVAAWNKKGEKQIVEKRSATEYDIAIYDSDNNEISRKTYDDKKSLQHFSKEFINGKLDIKI